MNLSLPIHPMLVHFPIAFYFLELLFLIQWIRKKDGAYLRFAKLVFALGFVFMIPALITGYRDAGGFSQIHGVVQSHFIGACSVLGLSVFRAVYWKMGKESSPRYSVYQVAGALAGNILVAITGFYGGMLVYG